MKLRSTLQAKKILENQSTAKYLKKFLFSNLQMLENFFGSEMFLEIPEKFQSTKPEFLPAFGAIHNLNFPENIQLEKLEKIPDEPFLWLYHSKINSQSYGLGADFLSEESAFWKCLAESVERYLWKKNDLLSGKNVLQASFRELSQKNILNPFSLAGFSEGQKKNQEILSFDQNTRFGWTEARSLTQGKGILCPAQLMNIPYFKKTVKSPANPKKNEPMLRWGVSTGLATGKTTTEALVKGILEIIERDAYMIAYLNKLSPDQIDLESLREQDSEIENILNAFDRYRLELTLLRLPTDFPVSVCFAIINDPSGIEPATVVAASADFDLRISILDALSECLSSRITLRRMKKNMPDIELDEKNLDRAGRLLYWAQTENMSKLDFFKKGKKISVDLSKEADFYISKDKEKLTEKYYSEKLNLLVRELRKKNYEACYVELTNAKAKRLRLRSVYVVVPELQPMHLEEVIPYFGGKRLREVPEKLGFFPAEKLNPIPQPFP